MTFDDDILRVNFPSGSKTITCKGLGVSWPPPEVIELGGFSFNRVRMSSLTDEQRIVMQNVCRGAEYEVAGTL